MPRLWILILTISVLVKYRVDADEITELPGQPGQVSFKQYSGYISIDGKQNRALFYYFVEAQTDPSSKPLVLWLNGGPGCSSVGVGAFSEHGPFQPNGQILVKNEYSWNREANMLYLESPAGVGFSFSANKSFYIGVDDQITAQDSFVFLRNWFEKFPQYKNRDFFITGESYAGHYAPQLAQLIVKSHNNFNLKGVAIGNPLLEFNIDLNSRAEYLWSHGLISDSTYKLFTSVCNYSQIYRQAINGNGNFSPVCASVFQQVSTEISDSVDAYDILLDVCISSVTTQSRMLYQLQEREKVDVCVQDETTVYLNRKDVQEALHARLIGVTNWSICSRVLKYKFQNLEVTTIPVLATLVNSGIRVLVFSGDQDSTIPFIGTRTLLYGLAKELKLNTTSPYRAWFDGRQVAGWTQVYDEKLSYATIRGGSHEAPFSQPKRSLVLFKAFLEGKPLPERNSIT